MSDKLKWAMIQLNNKASGGKNGFELDEIVPTIEQEIKSLESELKKRDEIIKELMKNTEINLRLMDVIMPEIKNILEGK